MSRLTLGQRLKIRSMVHMAAEPIPFFWPMRTFIHHNPLHGLEHLPFEQGVRQGEKLFHGRGFLPRTEYQRYHAEGKVDDATLGDDIRRFLAERDGIGELDLQGLLQTLLCRTPETVGVRLDLAEADDIKCAIDGGTRCAETPPDIDALEERLARQFPPERPLYESIDLLFGTEIGTTLDELVIKSCLDFFDEGQSTLQMPGREHGFFTAWSALAKRNLRLFLRGLHIKKILAQDTSAEGVIVYVLGELGIEEAHWDGLITRELTRLHGWAGFIRWRSSANRYHWSRTYPGDLIDFLAIRLVLGLALIREHARRKRLPASFPELAHYLEQHTAECYLRQAYHGGTVQPEWAHRVDDALAHKHPGHINRLLPEYLQAERIAEARRQADRLLSLAEAAGQTEALEALDAGQIDTLLTLLDEFEEGEGMMWLRAMEAVYRKSILDEIKLLPPAKREKRPFAQALFCIDVRSERIRRQLEHVGDYQTFGIAGFFGVPVSFIGLGKGTELDLCPVQITPKNVVLEVPTGATQIETDFYSSASHVLHDVKSSVLSPYFTVEAIGLLFGFDMIGKTVAPRVYDRWRNRIEPKDASTRLLIDKLSREQGDSIVRSLQRVTIVRAIGQQFGIDRDAITDSMIRELREIAMGNKEGSSEFARQFALSPSAEADFIETLRNEYRINPSFVSMQMERLGKIGFSLDEQVYFVGQALRMMGMKDSFSRFVLLVGHASESDNNPYESALDCGACGGGHGLVSARVLAQMANKSDVRRRLAEQGIHIPDDTWFVPALHNTTSDEIVLHDLDLLPTSHLVYMERLRNGLRAASRLCAAERLPTLEDGVDPGLDTTTAYRHIQRNTSDWTQVRPEWGLVRNASVVVGGRHLTEDMNLDGRSFLLSYDYTLDTKGRLLDTILSGPLIIGEWINLEHYFSAVDNEGFGSGSKAYHNVAGRFGVMTGNLSDIRTGLPSQTVLKDGRPYHEPVRLLVIIEAPVPHVLAAAGRVPKALSLIVNGWINVVVADPETGHLNFFDRGEWHDLGPAPQRAKQLESIDAEESPA
ncbi:MAG: DUF2309 domain-containing protein [Guyparkeria sp.]